MEALLTLPDFPLDGSIPTLGWGVAEWVEAWLRQPDGENAGEPLVLTREQLNFILWLYALDERGRFRYRRAVLRRAKGWGKSPFLAALALVELCGPVRFGGWAAPGEPIGVPEPMPWIVIAGVSETQTENTLSAVRGMIGEGSDLVDAYGLDVGVTRIFARGGGKIVPLTASAKTQEGARPTFAIMDETHHWTEANGGKALADVIRRNLAKRPGGTARAIETTNAHEPGGESVAEKSYLAHRAAVEKRTRRDDLLYDGREAPEVDLRDEAAVLEALRCAYGDSIWVDLERILAEFYDPDVPAEQSRRFYLNQIVAAADAWVSPPEWHGNRVDDLRPLTFGAPGRRSHTGDTVTLGFDGSLTDDSTALVACRVDDGSAWLLAIWEKPEGPAGTGWEVPKDEVRDAVAHAFEVLDVVAFFSDVAYWETDVDAWRDEHAERLLVKATAKHAVAWDMRGHQLDTTRAVEALHRAVIEGEIPWRSHDLMAGPAVGSDAGAILARHVGNARRRPNRWGVSFGKATRESPLKVDALAALVLARMARSRVLAEGALKKHRRGSGRVAGFS